MMRRLARRTSYASILNLRRRRTNVRRVSAGASCLYSKEAEFPTRGEECFSPVALSVHFASPRLRSKSQEWRGIMRLRPQSMHPPYSSTEVATAIGVSLDTFYRTRRLRHERDGLPSPISERGPLKWERTGFDAWLTRYHPMRRKTIANDAFAPPPAASDEEHRERLRRAYGQHDA
jgi:hypothetical protein